MEINRDRQEAEAYLKYERAKKRVKDIKAFYGHVKIYVVVNVLLLIGRSFLLEYLDIEKRNVEFQNWFDWNTLITPILWAIGLLAHGIYVFQFKSEVMKNWEQKKIQEFLDKEKTSTESFWE